MEKNFQLTTNPIYMYIFSFSLSICAAQYIHTKSRTYIDDLKTTVQILLLLIISGLIIHEDSFIESPPAYNNV